MKLSEIIKRVIALSTIVKNETHQRESAPSYDPTKPRKPTQAETDLQSYLHSQSIAVLNTLVLLMYAGSGVFPVEDFLEEYNVMSDTMDTAAFAVGKLMEKVPLPDYLTDALKDLAPQKIDVDFLME